VRHCRHRGCCAGSSRHARGSYAGAPKRMNIWAAMKQGGTNLICDSFRLLQADALIKLRFQDEAQRFVEEPDNGGRRFIVLGIRMVSGDDSLG
jgi:hypothetical protein